jgi:hypothetical protein
LVPILFFILFFFFFLVGPEIFVVVQIHEVFIDRCGFDLSLLFLNSLSVCFLSLLLERCRSLGICFLSLLLERCRSLGICFLSLLLELVFKSCRSLGIRLLDLRHENGFGLIEAAGEIFICSLLYLLALVFDLLFFFDQLFVITIDLIVCSVTLVAIVLEFIDFFLLLLHLIEGILHLALVLLLVHVNGSQIFLFY